MNFGVCPRNNWTLLDVGRAELLFPEAEALEFDSVVDVSRLQVVEILREVGHGQLLTLRYSWKKFQTDLSAAVKKSHDNCWQRRKIKILELNERENIAIALV